MSLPGYELGEVIAESEHTVVRRATRKSDGRRVVVKELRQAYPTLAVRRRMVLEHELLTQLRGPGIIEVIELARHEGRLALVTEDFGAQSLALPEGQVLELDELFPIALQAARALGRVHSAGILHKDVKPHNLLWNHQTGEVKLIDFQLATALGRESAELDPGKRLEGSLPYISPEQTGRMNRAVDYRSDYYSLGVSLFQLLTGQLPLLGSSVMEWVHAHISKAPLIAHEVRASIPEAVSRIIAKLLQKDPEARYQSFAGLVRDIERCQNAWQASKHIATFELAQGDVPERFQLSQRLVGRGPELQQLLEAFEQASSGPSRLLLVTGHAGVGKSSLIREIHKPMTAKRGRFVSGKFDQLDRNVPYGALLQAARQLVDGLLIEPDEVLLEWKAHLSKALGNNAQALVDLLPELESILGKQEACAELSPLEAQNRLHLVFGSFFRCFARSDSPLVLFLDDLQWTDASTPALLHDLLVRQSLNHLLVIAAYRDSEVAEGHLWCMALGQIRQARSEALSEVAVRPLSLAGVRALVSETLHLPVSEVEELARLVFEKTDGNPFFAGELLSELYRTGAVALNAERCSWGFDIESARLASVTANVVDLLIHRLEALPASSRELLSVAACVGNQFDLASIAQLTNSTFAEAAQAIWQPTLTGLVVPMGDTYRLARASSSEPEGRAEPAVRYRFQHDRVQQAAYSLIDVAERPRLHARLGRKLAADLDPVALAERIFEVTNHLNLGRELLESSREQQQLEELNVRAAQRASRSTAYAIASEHLSIAYDLLTERSHGEEREKAFELKSRLAEAVLMSGNTERATALLRQLEEEAPNLLERAEVHLLEARILDVQEKFVESVNAVRKGLALLGIELPTEMADIEQAIGAGIGKMQGHLAQRSVEQLLELPDLQDPQRLMAMKLLFQVIPAAIQTCPPLFVVAELTMFDIAVAYGLTPFSAKNFVDCGIIQGGMLGNYEVAYRLGQVAFRVIERFQARGVASSVNFVFGAYVSSWRAHHQEALDAFERCHRLAVETGDIQHAGFGIALRMHRLVHVGHDLAACHEELRTAIGFLERARLSSPRTAVILTERALARLCDTDSSPEQVAAEDEEATERVLATRNPQWIYAYAESQLLVSILLDDAQSAQRWQELAAPQLASAAGLISIPEYHLCELLNSTQYRWKQASEEQQGELLEQAKEVVEKLSVWADNCPDNFAHKHRLALAELARIEQQPMHVVLDHYRAAAESTQNAYIHMRALALELEARYCRQAGHEVFSQALLWEAHDLYAHWGARIKARQLEQLLREGSQRRGSRVSSASSRLSLSISTSHTTSGDTVIAGGLDLESVIKATRALASEVRADQLYASLMTTMLENAAAERGALILVDDDGALMVEARADSTQAKVEVERSPLGMATDLCPEVVRLVARSEKPLVLDNACEHSLFGKDPYVVQNGIKSVLCLPILHQGKLLAVLYAENNLTAHAFPSDRVATLHMIAAQAAVSLVNAKLYHNLEQKVEQRTLELATRNREIVAMLDGMDQGVFSVDDELNVLPQYSKRVPDLLGVAEPTGHHFVPLLFRGANISPEQLATLETALEFSFNSPVSLAGLNARHLVSEFSRTRPEGQEQHLEVDWKAIADDAGNVGKFLVVVRDVTELWRSREERARREWEAEVVQKILEVGVDEFRAFCEASRSSLSEAQRLLSASSPSQADLSQVHRSLHTVKGNARGIGLQRLVEEAHSAEELFVRLPSGSGWQVPDVTELQRRTQKVEALLGEHENIGEHSLGPLWAGAGSRLSRALEEIEAVLSHKSSRPSYPVQALRHIESTVARVHSVGVGEIVEQMTRGLASLALEVGKPCPSVSSNDPGLFVTEPWARVLKDALTHTFRNCIDHGIEPVAERRAAAKHDRGQIRLTWEANDAKLRLRLNDDGRGLDLARLRSMVADEGAADEVVAEAIFAAGTSTRTEVTQLSGRGVGMDAVRSGMRARGGDVRVRFTGTEQAGHRPFELLFELPHDARAPAAVRSSLLDQATLVP